MTLIYSNPTPYATNAATRLHTPRCELLLVPAKLLSDRQHRRVALRLGETLDRPATTSLSWGAWVLHLAVDSNGPVPDVAPPAGLHLTEGWWPDPVGLRVRLWVDRGAPAWMIESDRLGLRPIFSTVVGPGEQLVSTRPELLAAIEQRSIDLRGIAEQMLLGFNFATRTLFEGVKRLRPAERIGYDPGLGTRWQRTAQPQFPTDDWTRRTATVIAKAFERGDALELSGGVDSRLVLALGRAAGQSPRISFTLGYADDDDVRIARRVASVTGIEHIVLEPRADVADTPADGRSFVGRSAYTVNATSCAWMPAAFRRLDAYRTAQIGGGGGECATGFYDSPADLLASSTVARQWWVRNRLYRPGLEIAPLFGADRFVDLETTLVDDILKWLDAGPACWRDATNALYRDQRVPNAGGGVLSASACWYRPIQPLLFAPAISWSSSLAPRQRADRRRQLELIRSTDPALGRLPFAGRGAGRRLGTLRCRLDKLSRRLAGRRRRPDLGAAETASVLLRDREVRTELIAFTERHRLGTGHLAALLQRPERFEYELGGLLTAAWAESAAARLRADLDAPVTDADLHQARKAASTWSLAA